MQRLWGEKAMYMLNSLFTGYWGAFARLVSPGGGAFANLHCSGAGHSPTPGPNSDDLLENMQLKLSFCDWCISILSSKKCQTPIILADLLGNESFLQRVQKVIVCDLWLVDFDPFWGFLCFKVRCLCDQSSTLIFQIFLIDFIPGLETSKFRWDKNT